MDGRALKILKFQGFNSTSLDATVHEGFQGVSKYSYRCFSRNCFTFDTPYLFFMSLEILLAFKIPLCLVSQSTYDTFLNLVWLNIRIIQTKETFKRSQTTRLSQSKIPDSESAFNKELRWISNRNKIINY